MLTNIMDWFASKDITRGDAEGLADKLSLGDVKKNHIRKEISSSGLS